MVKTTALYRKFLNLFLAKHSLLVESLSLLQVLSPLQLLASLLANAPDEVCRGRRFYPKAHFHRKDSLPTVNYSLTFLLLSAFPCSSPAAGNDRRNGNSRNGPHNPTHVFQMYSFKYKSCVHCNGTHNLQLIQIYLNVPLTGLTAKASQKR